MKKLVMFACLALVGVAAHADEATVATADVAAAVDSIISANGKAYTRMVVARSSVHGCKVTDSPERERDRIPNEEVYMAAVLKRASAMDNGKYADFFKPSWPGAAYSARMPAQLATDVLHAYADSLRETYMKDVLAVALNAKCAGASEQWVEENKLPLPAQFTRAVTNEVRQESKFAYSLESEWAINKENVAETEFEKSAIKSVQQRKPVYATEVIAGKSYFSAAYPDIAVNNKCTGCHNAHPDSPRSDFKVGDVMGAMIVRIPLN